MGVSEAIRRMCEESGQGVVGVSQQLGKSKMYLSGMISRRTVPRVDTLAQIAKVCGYKLVLESSAGDRIEIEPELPRPRIAIEYDPSAHRIGDD